MTKNYEISVIVPAFNAERFIKDCVQSILAQSFSSFELILVNDGSEDSTLAICESFAKKDERIRAFSQSNQGVSAARNKGLENAKGRYVLFVDSDDTIEPHTLSALHFKATESDYELVSGGYCLHTNTGSSYVLCPAFSATSTAQLEPYLNKYFASMYIFGIHAQLILKSVIDEHNLRFKKEMSLMEDSEFFMGLFRHITKIANIEESFYNYYKRDDESSLSSLPRLDAMECCAHNVQLLTELFSFWGFEEQAESIRKDPAYKGTSVYYRQLNNAALKISFSEHKSRFHALLHSPDAKEELMKAASSSQGKISAFVSRICIKQGWALPLTVFTRVKSFILRKIFSF